MVMQRDVEDGDVPMLKLLPFFSQRKSLVSNQKPAEIMPGPDEMEQRFNQMVEDFWLRLFPTLLQLGGGGLPIEA